MAVKVKINIYCIFLTLILFLNLRCFYLVDTSAIPLDDVTLIIEAFFFVYVWLKTFHQRVTYRYGFFIFFTLVLALTSTIMAFYSYDQPLWLGFRPQRHWLGAMLMYFPIVKLLKTNRISKEQILRLIDGINVVFGLLILAQAVLGHSFIFLQVSTGDSRFGLIRMYISSSILLVSMFFHLNEWMKTGKFKFSHLFFVLLGSFIVIFIVQSRMRILSLILGVLVIVLLQKFSKRKLFVTLGVGVAVLALLMITGIGETVLNNLLGKVDGEDTGIIRETGRLFYIEQNLSNFFTAIFGSGFANSDWYPAYEGAGYTQGIYYNDNGIFGLFFYYGFLFVAWFLLFYLKLFRDSFKTKNIFCLGFLFMGFIGIYSLFPHCYESNIVFALIISFVEIQKSSVVSDCKEKYKQKMQLELGRL